RRDRGAGAGWAHAERPQTGAGQGAQCSTRPQEANHIHSKRRCLGRRKHDHRGSHSLGCYSPAKSGAGAGYRRIPLEQGGGVMKVLRGRAAARQVTRLAERGKDTSAAEKAAVPIIRDVRRKGDAAVRKYAQRSDKLEDSKPLRIAPEEMHAAWEDLSKDKRAALQQAAPRIRD